MNTENRSPDPNTVQVVADNAILEIVIEQNLQNFYNLISLNQ